MDFQSEQNVNYTVRVATADDIPAMIHLERQSPGAAHWSERQYVGLFDQKNGSRRLTLVAELSAENPLVSGFLVAHHIAPEWELENIVVAPQAQRRGVATGLMQELFGRAVRSEGRSVVLEVRESNRAARGLYEKLGFRLSGHRKSYYLNPLEDAVHYLRELR